MSNDTGRVAGATGLSSDDQAASRLDPSGFDPSRYKVGQKLWMQGSQRYNASGYVVVAKVGRKWASLHREGANYEVGRVEIGKREIDGGGYISPGRLYRDREEYLEEVAVDTLWGKVRDIASAYRRPRHMTRDRVIQVLRILRDSDASLAEDPKGLSGEAVAARADEGGIAQGDPQ